MVQTIERPAGAVGLVVTVEVASPLVHDVDVVAVGVVAALNRGALRSAIRQPNLAPLL